MKQSILLALSLVLFSSDVFAAPPEGFPYRLGGKACTATSMPCNAIYVWRDDNASYTSGLNYLPTLTPTVTTDSHLFLVDTTDWSGDITEPIGAKVTSPTHGDYFFTEWVDYGVLTQFQPTWTWFTYGLATGVLFYFVILFAGMAFRMVRDGLRDFTR